MARQAKAPESTTPQGQAASPTGAVLTDADREFLPAALEIVETPASPLPVAILLASCLFIAVMIGWAFFGRLEVHAVGVGKIETAGRSKIVQPLEAGRVRAVSVSNGARVRAGDLLVQLDDAEAKAEEQLQAEIVAASGAEAARRATMLGMMRAIAAGATPEDGIAFPTGVPTAIRNREAAVLAAEIANFRDLLANNDKQVAQRRASRERFEASISHQMRLIETLESRVDVRQQSLKLSVGTRISLFDALESLDRSRAQLAGDRGQLLEVDAGIAELGAQRARYFSQIAAEQTTKLADAEKKRDEALQQLAKARARLDRLRLVAPIDGTVQQVAVTTVGQVVTTGQSLMTIVPEGAPLQVEIFISNKDIGFIRPGQDVAVKVDAFNFTRYGSLHGTVERIAGEAIEEGEARRSMANATAAGQPGSAPAPGQPQNFVFPVTVAIKERAMMVDGNAVPLTAGMTVTAEIVTDTRRIIDYFLSPIARTTSEALKER